MCYALLVLNCGCAVQVTEAVELLERHGLYREAVCVARLRLSPEDPSHGRLLRRWADQLTADGNMEQAAKW